MNNRPDAFVNVTYEAVAVSDRTKSCIDPKVKWAAGLLYFRFMFDHYRLHVQELKKELYEINPANDISAVFPGKYRNSMAAITNGFNEFRKETMQGQDTQALEVRNRKTHEKTIMPDNYK